MKAAPSFSLPDQTGTLRSLKDFAGQWVLLYFYPRDNTPGCTKEACTFRDAIAKFEKLNIQILGCSKDSVESHKKFADKFKLPFPLLSDPDQTVHKQYGAWTEKGFMGRPGTLRNSYLIDPEGNIVKEYSKVNPLSHSSQILEDFQTLQQENKAKLA